MNTSQLWPFWLLGSTLKFEPYQTTSARPGPPAFIQGKTLTMEGEELTWTGALQFLHPLAALATLTKVCRRVGSPSVGLRVQVTKRFVAVSKDSTVKRVFGDPGSLSARVKRVEWFGT